MREGDLPEERRIESTLDEPGDRRPHPVPVGSPSSAGRVGGWALRTADGPSRTGAGRLPIRQGASPERGHHVQVDPAHSPLVLEDVELIELDAHPDGMTMPRLL